MIRRRPACLPRTVAAALLALPALVACAAVAVAAPALRDYRLANGLRVILSPDPHANVTDVATWYDAGTRFEPAGSSGVTQLVERMLFAGPATGAGARLRAAVDERGGLASTLGTPDVSSFYTTLPPEGVADALGLEASRMNAAALDATALSAAKRAAGEARRRGGPGQGVARGLEKLYAMAFAGHPYQAPAAGLDRERDAVTLARARSYHAERFVPGNALLTVTGRFAPDSVERWIERAFGALPAKFAPPASPAALPSGPGTRATVEADTPVPLLVVGWRAPGGSDSARVALRVLSRILAQGRFATLPRALAGFPGELVVGVDGAADIRREASLLYAVVALRAPFDTAAVEDSLAVLTRLLAARPPDETMLRAITARLDLEQRLERQSPRGRAGALATAARFTGEPATDERDLERVLTLGADEVHALARRVFVPEARFTVWVWPRGGPAATRGTR